jgi:hypothetical protein
MYTDLIQRKVAKRQWRKTLNHRSTQMNADAKGLQARQMKDRGEAGYADWLTADEAALDYIATHIEPMFGVSTEVLAKRLRAEKLWPTN